MPWGIVIGSDSSFPCSSYRSTTINRTQGEDPEIREIKEKLKSDISIVRESIGNSITNLQKVLEETVQRLETNAAEKIEQIKNKKGGA